MTSEIEEVRRRFCPSCRQWRWPSAFAGKSQVPHFSGMCRGCRKFLGAISHTRGKITACETRKTKYATELGALLKQIRSLPPRGGMKDHRTTTLEGVS